MKNREIHVLAASVHGALTILHCIGILYNIRKKNWFDVTAHTLAAGYDLVSINNHRKAIQGE